MTTVVIAREFRGQTIYLTSAERGAFNWSCFKDRALPLSVDVAKRIIVEAQEYKANAYAIDKNGHVIIPGLARSDVLNKIERNAHFYNKADILNSARNCRYDDCRAPLPGPYGTPGVSLSRADNKTLICAECGVREAMDASLLGSKFKGDPEFWLNGGVRS